jgi:hypothetical protein
MWDIELRGSSCRCWQLGNFGEQLEGAPAQSDEADTHGIEPIEPRMGSEFGIQDETLGRVAMLALPEIDEAKDFVGLLALANIGVGIAEHLGFRILR